MCYHGGHVAPGLSHSGRHWGFVCVPGVTAGWQRGYWEPRFGVNLMGSNLPLLSWTGIRPSRDYFLFSKTGLLMLVGPSCTLRTSALQLTQWLVQCAPAGGSPEGALKVLLSLISMILGRPWVKSFANFCKGPGSEYLRLCRSHRVSNTCSFFSLFATL